MSDPEINGQAAPAEESNTGQALLSPGARLAAYRNEKGWTVEQVASQLNLAPRQIVAIESDDYAALPGMPIARGFIRAYAKLLKVDAAPLLAKLESEPTSANESIVPRKTLSTPFSEARLPSMTDRPGLSSKWIIGALLVLLVGVAVWASRQGAGVVEPPKQSPVATQEGQAEMPAPDKAEHPAPNATTEAPVVTPGATGVPDPAGSGTNAAPSAGGTAAPVTPSQLTSPAAASPAQGAASASGSDTLRLTAREDSWVEIRRAGSNAVLLSRILKAGESETVQVTEPVLLVIGNAAGVDASLRGAPLELKPSTKSNVARLNLK